VSSSQNAFERVEENRTSISVKMWFTWCGYLLYFSLYCTNGICEVYFNNLSYAKKITEPLVLWNKNYWFTSSFFSSNLSDECVILFSFACFFYCTLSILLQ